MAKAFTKLKDPKLQLTDKLLFGKFYGCRICDVIEEDYMYFDWLSKNSDIKFSDEVHNTVAEFKRQANEERHTEEEEKPWAAADAAGNFFFSDWDDDIPF